VPGRARARLCALACSLLLAACAAPQTRSLIEGRGVDLPPAARIAVPFFAQDRYQCGPAALAMLLSEGGIDVRPDDLTALVYLPARGGSLQAEMLAAARRHGRLAVALPPRLDAVLGEVAAGHPVIVLQNLSLPVAPVWHYAVVIGFDLAAREIVMHSGLESEQRLALPVFERTWARSGHWAMVATDPALPPRTPPLDVLVAAAAALERLDAAAARRSYAALLDRSPSDVGAWIGLGNTAFAQRDLESARAAFERVTQLAPGNGDGWNNLAVVLLDLGRIEQAHAAAARAADLGGVRAERYRQTLRAIDDRRR
jgi:tetratricopeptide (TPR) repeat protein